MPRWVKNEQGEWVNGRKQMRHEVRVRQVEIRRYGKRNYSVAAELRDLSDRLFALASKLEADKPELAISCYHELVNAIKVGVSAVQGKLFKESARAVADQIDSLRASAALRIAMKRQREMQTVEVTAEEPTNGQRNADA